jgi:hypothetical protein
MTHFTTDNKPTLLSKIIFILLVPLCLINMWLFYEYSHEPRYWKNRWRFYFLLRKGKVKVIESSVEDYPYQRERFTLKIDDELYHMEIWNRKEMTLDSSDRNYIGLFIGSVTTKFLNKNAIKTVRKLSDIQEIRDIKLIKLGIK